MCDHNNNIIIPSHDATKRIAITRPVCTENKTTNKNRGNEKGKQIIMSTQNPTFAQPSQGSAPGAAPGMSGKNALLARIQAAKAKAQQTAAKPAPTVDLLDLGSPPAPAAPAAAATNDADLLGGGSAPPAAPAAAAETATTTTTVAAPAATDSSATFESLMATTAQPQSRPGPAAEAAPASSSAAPDIDEDILAALPPEEREALLEEQRRIMEEIETKKIGAESSGAAARAMAFNQRSSAAVADVVAGGGSFEAPAFARPPGTGAAAAAAVPANGNDTVDLGHGEVVPIYGNEETQEAIKDGTALVVQCMNCQSWMQVTGEANLMLCPSCGVVVPVEKAGAATTANMETAAQVAADQQLAEELQKEEYKQAAGQQQQRRQQQRERRVEGPAPNGKSWLEWIAGTPAPAPGASASASPRGPGSEERRGLIGSPDRPAAAASSSSSPGGGGGARVAQQPQSIFACVAGSVAAAAEQMTGISLTEDKEGNVHGVDSSSLLTMP